MRVSDSFQERKSGSQSAIVNDTIDASYWLSQSFSTNLKVCRVPKCSNILCIL